MTMGMNQYSLSDIAALTKSNSGLGGGEGGFIWLLFIFLFFGRNGFGGNAASEALTRAELNQGLNDNNVTRKLDGIINGISDSTFALNNAVKDGFTGVNTQLNGVVTAIKDCCCETNRNIDSIRSEAYKNTCDIIRTVEKDGDATRALINANTVQDLRDKVAEKDRDALVKDLGLSQAAQTSTILDRLGFYTPRQGANPCNPCYGY